VTKKIDLNEILKKNRHICPKDLAESIALGDKLQQAGIRPRGYQLAPPYARQRPNTNLAEEPDPRTIHLSVCR
jgi:hypothetical protein